LQEIQQRLDEIKSLSNRLIFVVQVVAEVDKQLHILQVVEWIAKMVEVG